MTNYHAIREYFNEEGKVLPIEASEIPFPFKRVFFISNVPSSGRRGNHAHRKCEQFFVRLAGSFQVRLIRGEDVETFFFSAEKPVQERGLPEPVMTWLSGGLHVSALTWVIVESISADAVICVFASHAYDPLDYVNSFLEFSELQKCQE